MRVLSASVDFAAIAFTPSVANNIAERHAPSATCRVRGIRHSSWIYDNIGLTMWVSRVIQY